MCGKRDIESRVREGVKAAREEEKEEGGLEEEMTEHLGVGYRELAFDP